MKVKELAAEMTITNLQPMVLVQANQNNQALIDAIATMGQDAPRTVVVAGAAEVEATPPFQRIQTRIRTSPLLELVTLPLENIGAATIRRYARGEKLDDPIETRQARRERQLKERKNP